MISLLFLKNQILKVQSFYKLVYPTGQLSEPLIVLLGKTEKKSWWNILRIY